MSVRRASSTPPMISTPIAAIRTVIGETEST
jgi:hypothetical protein